MQKLTTKQSHTDQREEDKQNGPKRSHTRRAPTTTARTLCLRNQQVQPGPMIEPKPETRKRNRLSCDQKDTFSERIWRMPFIQLTYSLTHSPTSCLSVCPSPHETSREAFVGLPPRDLREDGKSSRYDNPQIYLLYKWAGYVWHGASLCAPSSPTTTIPRLD